MTPGMVHITSNIVISRWPISDNKCRTFFRLPLEFLWNLEVISPQASTTNKLVHPYRLLNFIFSLMFVKQLLQTDFRRVLFLDVLAMDSGSQSRALTQLSLIWFCLSSSLTGFWLRTSSPLTCLVDRPQHCGDENFLLRKRRFICGSGRFAPSLPLFQPCLGNLSGDKRGRFGSGPSVIMQFCLLVHSGYPACHLLGGI